MGRNDGVEARKERLQTVNQTIMAALNLNKDKDGILLDVMMANIEYSTGLTPKRIMEYAAIGEKRGLFVIDVKNNRIKKAES